MPRANQQRIVDQKVIDAISNPQSIQPAASPVDQGTTDNSWLGVSQALSAFNPKLEELAAIKASQASDQGASDRKLGLSPAENADAMYMEGYNRLDGYVKGKDAEAAFTAEVAGMSKDGASLKDKNGVSVTFDAFAANWVTEQKKAIQNPSVLKSYESVLGDAVDKMRGTHRAALLEDVTQTQEANAQKWMTDNIRQYVEKGQPISTQHLALMRKDLDLQFGTTGAKYNEMLFNSLSELSGEGNYEVWDVTKENRPDGTPGIFHIPEMQKRIISAQNTSMLRFAQRSEATEKATKKAREKKGEDLLVGVMMEAATGDPVKADRMFTEALLANPGLFNATEVVEWTARKKSMLKERESPEQVNNEADLMGGVWSGKVGIPGILNALKSKAITGGQSTSLISAAGQYAGQMRAMSSANKTVDAYSRANGEQLLMGALPPTAGEFDFNKSEMLAAQKASRNQANKEYIMLITNPSFKGSYLDASNEIAQKYRKAWDANGWQVKQDGVLNPNMPLPRVPLPKTKLDTSSHKLIRDNVEKGTWTVEEGRKQRDLLNGHIQK